MFAATPALISATVLAVLLSSCAQGSIDNEQTASAATTGTATAGAQTNQQTATTPCEPLETREPNASDQEPAFPAQTRACAMTSEVTPQVTVVAKGLVHPWAVEPLPGGDLLVTERPGRMRIVTAGGQIGEPISGLPDVDAGRQGGLLDVTLSPGFATDRTIYWSFTEPRQGGNGTSVARGVLSQDRRRLENVRVIFRAMPTYDNGMHFGSRIVIAPDGNLHVTLGERSDRETRHHSQQADTHLGTTVRIRPDGSAPPDNPFVNGKGAPEVWTIGHRNVQAADFDSQGRLWIVDHGPRGGDEVNLLEPGKNYGWPVVTYGEEYSGQPIPNAETQRQGFEQPIYYWDPVIAPSGAQFYSGNLFAGWQGNLLIGGLITEGLVRLRIENDRVTGEEHLLTDRGQRIRDVRQAADGALYIVTDHKNGELWRVTPQ